MNRLCFLTLIGIALSISALASEPVYEAEIFEFAPHWGEPHQPLKIEEKDSAAARFKAGESFTSVMVCCPSFSNNVGSLRLSLFRWTDNYDKTIAEKPLLRQTFVNFRDNERLELRTSSESPLPAGEYLLVIDSGTEQVGVWTQGNPVNPGAVQCFFNGKSMEQNIQICWLTPRLSPFPFQGTWEKYKLASAPASCPPEPKLKDDDPILKYDVQPDCFAATDDLARTLPDQSDVGPVRLEKLVGIFYWTWHQGGHTSHNRVYNNTQTIRDNPGIEERPDDPAWGEMHRPHHWDKPLLDYYKSTDKWVLRKHAQMLANAQIDVAIFDCTNATMTWMESTWALLETWSEARKDGVKTPKIAFMLPFWDWNYNAVDLRQLYRDIYRDGKYQELWFYWQGKPLIYAIPDVVDQKIAETSGEEKQEWEAIRSFFAFRPGQPGYTCGPLRPDNWSWLEVYPQKGYGKRADGTYDMICVGAAQNHSENKRDGSSGLAAMNDRNVFGRAWQVGKEKDPRPDAFKYGLNFEQQWDRAYQLDPQFVFVTGWNEWIAGRYPVWQGQVNAFPDEYDQRFSRDVEPCDGELRDIYYNQLVAKVRQFKGVRPVPKFGKVVTIPFDSKTDASSDPWESVEPTFRDYRGDIMNRNAEGYAQIRYTDDSGRNDIVLSKVARDDKYVYFMVETNDALTSCSDRNWMQLFISVTDDSNTPFWYGFEFVVNRTSPGEKAVLERSKGGWNWERVSAVDYRVTGNRLELRIERSALGLTANKPISLRFKWVDNGFRSEEESKASQPDILDFYKYGDAAPDGRFSFQIREE
ncbi:MAG: hypothetical protein IJH67_11305 [Thermoguttaceae bacterium]|nr:hypothetical protein [Thermoguttaceae bacterium]